MRLELMGIFLVGAATVAPTVSHSRIPSVPLSPQASATFTDAAGDRFWFEHQVTSGSGIWETVLTVPAVASSGVIMRQLSASDAGGVIPLLAEDVGLKVRRAASGCEIPLGKIGRSISINGGPKENLCILDALDDQGFWLAPGDELLVAQFGYTSSAVLVGGGEID